MRPEGGLCVIRTFLMQPVEGCINPLTVSGVHSKNETLPRPLNCPSMNLTQTKRRIANLSGKNTMELQQQEA